MERVRRICWWLVAVGSLAAVIGAGYVSMVKLPRDYTVLERRGVVVPARFVGCTGTEDRVCRLRPLIDPRAVWEFRENVDQFDRVPWRGRVDVLVDPEHPSLRHTVADVRERANAGFSPPFLFGMVSAIVALAFAVFMLTRSAPQRLRD